MGGDARVGAQNADDVRPIAIGSGLHPYPLGRIVCECGWEHRLTEADTKEALEALARDHYDSQHGWYCTDLCDHATGQYQCEQIEHTDGSIGQ